MEMIEVEVAAVLNATVQAGEALVELNELELAMIGGGCGEVVFG